MKIFLAFLVIMLSSCGLFKTHKDLTARGYDLAKDTVIIKDFEYFINRRGYNPQFHELNPANKLNARISIKGFEGVDSISLNELGRELSFTTDDPSIKSFSGEVILTTGIGRSSFKLKDQNLENACLCFQSFYKKSPPKGSIVFFWGFITSKDGIVYTLPARKYYIR